MNTESAHELLKILKPSPSWVATPPATEELFSQERLEEYAAVLAHELKTAPVSKRGRSLNPELKQSSEKLEKAYRFLAGAIRDKQSVSPAAEWFVDNYHLVENQLREIKQSLPEDYYYGLPQLSEGSMKGYPRVYALALALIAHTDSRLDPVALTRVVQSFQTKSPLQIGEIWALVISLRIGLIQHLTPLAESIVNARLNRLRADSFADRILNAAGKPFSDSRNLEKMLSLELGPSEKWDRAFIVQLIQRLRDQEPDVRPAFDIIEKELSKFEMTPQQLTQAEHHRQAATQVTIGHIMGSLRILGTMDWRDFAEDVHLGEAILKQDPEGAYEKMDFATRDEYRHAIERVSKRSKATELQVAEKAIELSKQSQPGERSHHVGYYLIDDGRDALEKSLSYKKTLRESVERFIHQHPTLIYLSGVLFLTMIFWIPVLALLDFYAASPGLSVFFALLSLPPSSEMGLSLLNLYVNHLVKPKPLPRMDLREGIPPEAGTFVVIPTLLTSIPNVQEMIDRLEIHWLANQDPSLKFGLLGDFADAETETTATDREILSFAQQAIEKLNHRHPAASPRFHLFVRKRLWNPSEGKWIGWERKRGKLLEFNKLLRGATDTSYIYTSCPQEDLSFIRYVATLDSDTQVPRDALQKLVATILHPLNRPYFEPSSGRVTAGYGVLQPRISITSASAEASRFARISSGNIGMDPYTTAVSDVYQDLFREGSFTGKGLYDVDAFEKTMENRVPENAVLSHDLFEGSFARSALVTDVEFLDDYPSDYDKFSKRSHRWTRGDWQISAWLKSKVRDAGGTKTRNPLPLIAKWKIFDNLRRSLVPVSAWLWLTLAWTVLPGSAVLWTSLIVLMYLFPVYSTAATGKWLRRGPVTWRGFMFQSWQNFILKIQQILITLTFLAEQAWVQTDAILRAFHRMWISKKKLLEWTTHAQLESHSQGPLKFSEWTSPGPLLTLFLTALIALTSPERWPIAAPFLSLWFLNPILKRWLAQRPQRRKLPLSINERRELRLMARSTWHFFETFVTADDNWLAPDNFQEDPSPVVAHRTSPTNIGLQLLASSSAFDLGYLGHLELIEKTEKTFASLNKLKRFHGHFYNWYETVTLEPLNPRYVSTVDSGNLAGHLLTFKQFLLQISQHRRSFSQLKNGLQDTFFKLLELLPIATPPASLTSQSLRKIWLDCLRQAEESSMSSDKEWEEVLRQIGSYLLESKNLMKTLSVEENPEKVADLQDWHESALHQVYELKRDQIASRQSWQERLESLAHQCEAWVLEMDFSFLFDEKRKLFSIGFNLNDHRRDNSYYDLLASESRLASFIAIAKGDVDQEHWFRLGRQMTPVPGGRALIAWTATMFEYLMPLLVMKRFENTLLAETYDAIVKRQIQYGQEKNAPWGVSEAGFNARDLQMNYQYGPFGIPGLGLKRGLSDDLVISPYSTFLAALVDPQSALQNLKDLRRLGAYSRFGFYESLDYTAERIPKKQKFVVLKSYMAHHQGMSLVAVDNVLHDNIMQKRFHEDPLVKSTQLLLQERVPADIPLSRPRTEEIRNNGFLHAFDPAPRTYSDVNLNLPRTQILSNGTYSVLVTSTGGGYSKCGPLSLTRWREDPTRDHWGQFFYVRNRQTGHCWSAAHQPTLIAPQKFEALLGEEKVEFLRRDQEILTKTEILVSPEDNVELRRITLTNESKEVVDLEITSFMEITLAKPQDDSAHPAFSNLFIQTEFEASDSALLATRRQRSKKEAQPWAFHLLSTNAATLGVPQYETDRARFLGRGRTPQNALVISESRPLSNTVGPVLDPIFSLRQTLRLQPNETSSIQFVTGFGFSREEVLHLMSKYKDLPIFQRESEIAWTQSQVQLRHLNISAAQAHTFQKLAGRVLYLDSSLRPSSRVLAQNSRTQSNLWTYGISGDIPIILTRIHDEKDMSLIRELLRAHEYLRLKGLTVDLVILNERPTSYLQSLQDEIHRQVRMSGAHSLLDKPGGIFLRRTDLMPTEDIVLLRTVARVTLNADQGTLEEQLRSRKPRGEMPPSLSTKSSIRPHSNPELLVPELKFFNGLGGFSKDDREYVIHLQDGQNTPAPWSNVISNNKDFGFVVTENGSGFTWSANSRENRLTPWSNDPVSDPPGEIIYLRDEFTGEVWSPTPLPIRGSEPYLIRHSAGNTRFEHNSHGLSHVLDLYVAPDDEVKISRLKIKNNSPVSRSISVTSYIEWVLGFQKSQTSAFVIADRDEATGAVFARNPYNNEFAHRVAFTDISEPERSFTCDRREFFGRNGSLSHPAGLLREHLSGACGAGLDPCTAIQTKLKLAPSEERTIVILLGQADSTEAARDLVRKYRNPQKAEKAFLEVQALWEKTFSSLQIQTPDAAMNTLVNRWLLYQTLACRVWARSAFYQSGGAYGFRDQLQDIMAVTYSHPQIAREQILRAASRQFPQGDVQHWWHPPTGRGVRTHFSDDLIWLPFVLTHYLKITGDESILEEVVAYIEGPELHEGQDDLYLHPQISDYEENLYGHCARALDRSLKTGAHGLPLMGSGDWNDGMNRVGHEGRGESVWVAWFLHSALNRFIPVCEKKNDWQRADTYRRHLQKLKEALETQAWDGDWYRRAYFDDGTPLGSSMNEECRIDSIAQSWSVLSGAGDSERSRRAMNAVDEHLIRRGDGLIQLFTPAFDKTDLDPGYIKGYVPGVRENGGQYTHAAIWTMMAFAELGDGEKAVELYGLLNPINHALTRAGMHKYKVEPYVVAADIYGREPHIGRGGWTWYTGSSSWMYRSALESLLGFEVEGSRFRVRPKVTKSWDHFEIKYKYKTATYQIRAERQSDSMPSQIECDGVLQSSEWIECIDDGQIHAVVLRFKP